ncbi:cytochrome P450 [Colletotrichum phormii]|uniref:Cytochrome P450 n=1 Tax=Colletotrichum phormii TaxID=359342 RepID=A0AAI9ZVQ1_9PEZI|nr:cytochrome P450 [Colletotrichum phormii]KAK1637724.1 cytochrome P450 [Colletotrichum phormii]
MSLPSLEKAFAAVAADFDGKLDIFVACAGVNKNVQFLDTEEADFDRLYGVNCKGLYFSAKMAAKAMIANGTKCGSIIFVASIASYIAIRSQRSTAYCGTKGAVRAMVAPIAAELNKYGIRVNSISPGYVRTEMTAPFPDLLEGWKDEIMNGRVAEPDDIKGACVFLASDASKYCQGSDILVDGGVTKCSISAAACLSFAASHAVRIHVISPPFIIDIQVSRLDRNFENMGLFADLLAILAKESFKLPLVAPLATLCTYFFFNVFLHPLRKVPGPWKATLSPLWLWYHSYAGDETTSVEALHKIYGPVVRIGPNDIDISDGAALAPIYSEKGGFLKTPCYSNFDFDGHPTIFSALDPAHRAVRSKAVVSMFSPASIRKEGDQILRSCVDRLMEHIRQEAASGKPVNMLNMGRCLALDAVTEYLLGKTYGGISELEASRSANDSSKLSASEFVDTFVAVGRFFLLPNWIFHAFEWALPKLFPDQKVDESMDLVTSFCNQVVAEADPEKDQTYQARLLRAGISKAEAAIQCMDLMFAGTDSTGMNFGAICWHLAQSPSTYQKLKEELASPETAQADPQTLPYLRGVVREGLRMSMANPTRLPRVVPPTGFSFATKMPSGETKNFEFPGGTWIGCAPFSLHFNDAVFPNPQEFQPERWLDPSEEMLRDAIPFGLGPRQCIARNLASSELFWAVRALGTSGVLDGAKPTGLMKDGIIVDEWFNSKVPGHAIELIWESP